MINSNIVCIDNNNQCCYTVTQKHINSVVSGDTIIFTDNKLTTVSKNNIKHDILGTTLFGYNYKGGKELVKVVTFCLNPNNI